jgi:hypothetical protein
MNFHPDKQLFQVAGDGDRTADPWITKPVLYLYTMGDPLALILASNKPKYDNRLFKELQVQYKKTISSMNVVYIKLF